MLTLEIVFVLGWNIWAISRGLYELVIFHADDVVTPPRRPDTEPGKYADLSPMAPDQSLKWLARAAMKRGSVPSGTFARDSLRTRGSPCARRKK
jgi:hypothetical protein